MSTELLITLISTLVTLLIAIIGVGITLGLMIQNGRKENQSQMNRLEGRVTGLEGVMRDRMNRLEDRSTGVEGTFRDRIGWLEGLQGLHRGSVVNWRGLGQTEPEAED